MVDKINREQFEKLLKKGELVLVDFFGSWCGPCKMFAPVYAEVSENVGSTLVKVDIDEETELASDYFVMGVPTVVAFKNGEEIGRFTGFKSKEDLLTFIKENE